MPLRVIFFAFLSLHLNPKFAFAVQKDTKSINSHKIKWKSQTFSTSSYRCFPSSSTFAFSFFFCHLSLVCKRQDSFFHFQWVVYHYGIDRHYAFPMWKSWTCGYVFTFHLVSNILNIFFHLIASFIGIVYYYHVIRFFLRQHTTNTPICIINRCLQDNC